MMRVLIVEDEKAIRESLASYLEAKGLDVLTAGSSREALDILRREGADAAVVDMRLPDATGDDFMLEANALRPGMRFIGHTGTSDYMPSPELTAMGVTMDAVFRKPLVDMETLYAALVWMRGA